MSDNSSGTAAAAGKTGGKKPSNHPRDGGKTWAAAEDEIILEIVAQKKAEAGNYTFPSKRIQEALQARIGSERTIAMIRNRHQRLEQIDKVPEDKFKNKCRKCGLPQRGHICKAGSPAKRARSEDLPSSSRDDRPPPLRSSTDPVRYEREEMEMTHVPSAGLAYVSTEGASAPRMPPALTRSQSKEDPGDRMPKMRGGHSNTISMVINEDFDTMERKEMAEALLGLAPAQV